jgi:pyruvate formate lyase activating enzyme
MLCPEHDDGDRLISRSIGVCSDCVRKGAVEKAQQTHEKLRHRDGLVISVPVNGKIVCSECGNHCRLNEGDIGFCNIRIVSEGEIVDRYSKSAVVSWYFDPLPTNCVADWVCPITTNRELGSGKKRLKNFAVFYGSCNSDCLFCQNASYRTMMAKGTPLMTAEELSECADDHTACVCYFGGDPSCNPEHSVRTSNLLNENRSITVCYELMAIFQRIGLRKSPG